MRGHIDVQESTAGMFNNHKHVEQVEGRRNRNTEVTRHNGLGMVAYKGPPALGLYAFAWTPVHVLRHILPHGAWRDPQAELQPQLIRDIQRELFTEKEIFGGQGSGWTEAEPQEAYHIAQESQKDTGELHEVTEQVRRARHRQGILLQYR